MIEPLPPPRAAPMLALVLLLAAGGALAQTTPTLPGSDPGPIPAAPALLPLDALVAAAAGRYRGTLLDARTVRGRPHEGGGPVQELRWLTPAGDVLRLRLDALTGAMLEADGRGLAGARRP